MAAVAEVLNDSGLDPSIGCFVCDGVWRDYRRGLYDIQKVVWMWRCITQSCKWVWCGDRQYNVWNDVELKQIWTMCGVHGITVQMRCWRDECHLFQCCVRSIEFANEFGMVDKMCHSTKDAGAWGECALDGWHAVGEDDTARCDAQWRRKTFLNAPKVRSVHEWYILPTKNRHVNT